MTKKKKYETPTCDSFTYQVDVITASPVGTDFYDVQQNPWGINILGEFSE